MAKQEKEGLNPQQEEFCQLYSTSEEFFAHGTNAYIEAYDINVKSKSDYFSAAASASRLLKDVKILNRINELLELRGLNDTFVDKQLEFLITQNADLGTKVASIREYNKLRSRIINRTEITLPTPILGGITNEVRTDDSSTETTQS